MSESNYTRLRARVCVLYVCLICSIVCAFSFLLSHIGIVNKNSKANVRSKYTRACCTAFAPVCCCQFRARLAAICKHIHTRNTHTRAHTHTRTYARIRSYPQNTHTHAHDMHTHTRVCGTAFAPVCCCHLGARLAPICNHINTRAHTHAQVHARSYSHTHLCTHALMHTKYTHARKSTLITAPAAPYSPLSAAIWGLAPQQSVST